MCKLKFKDILNQKDGITKGPFGGDIKKAYFVPKGDSTYKVYEQGVVYEKNINYGTYYIDKERFEKLKKFRVETGDLLLTGAGTLGELFEVPKEHEPGVINQALLRIRLNESVVDKEFFKFYFKWYIKDIVCRINGDSVIPNLPPIAMLKETEIDIPGIALQSKISKVLTTLENKLNNNKKINVELEAMAKTIYDYWFLQFEFPNEEGKPYKSSGGKMVWCDKLKREIPEKWQVKRLEELAQLGNGINYDKNEEGDKKYQIVNVRNISSSSLLINRANCDVICLKKSLADKYLIGDNDILIARSGTPGAIRLLIDNCNTIYCGFIIHCVPNDGCLRFYLTYALKQFEGTAATVTGGSILKNVSQETLKPIAIVIPSTTVLKEFDNLIKPLISQMQRILKENQELTSLRDFLLPMLMNGQVGFKS